MRTPSSLRLRVGASHAFAAALLGLHLAVAAIPWLIDMTPPLATAASAVLLGWGGLQVRRYALARHQASIVECSLDGDGRATLATRDGTARGGRLAEARVLGPWIVFLRFRLDDDTVSATVICRDACPADDFRRLRVMVRWVFAAQVSVASASGGPPRDG